MNVFIKMVVTASVLLAGITTYAKAEELDAPVKMFVRGALFCNTQEELEIVLTGISVTGGTYASDMPENCGKFSPRTPIPMTVTPVSVYETPMAFTVIAKFVFEPNGWTQYGWVKYQLKPDYVPPVQDEAL
jgi:hypothetical protein